MRKQRWSRGKAYLASAFVILCMLILYLAVFPLSNGQTMEKYRDFSWQHYAGSLVDTWIITIVINTLLVAFLASLLATIIGTLGALAIKDVWRPWRDSLLSLNNVLMAPPGIIIGASLLVFFTIPGVRLGLVSALLSHIAFCIPTVVLMVLPKLNEVSPTLVDAAYDLGVNRWQALSRVALSSIAPSIFAGRLMASAYSLSDFAVTFSVTGNDFLTLSVGIYSRAWQGINLGINALPASIFTVSFLLIIDYHLVSKRGG